MPADRPLEPEARTVYGQSLRPPGGYRFDAAVATTYSLDIETAIAASVALALFAAEAREELLASPLAMLEGLERSAERLAIFCEGGRMAAEAQRQSRLAILLEQIVTEAAAPSGGAFHPKLWAIRYRPLDPKERTRMRLLILSRNLTRDRSWDLALTLDGEVKGRSRVANRPVTDLLRALPGMATGTPAPHVAGLVSSIATDIDRVEWEPPEPFDGLSFSVHGASSKQWQMGQCQKLAVISPFVDAHAFQTLAQMSATPPILVSRTETLAELPPKTLEMASGAFVMEEAAETEDGDDETPDRVISEVLSGLHAKAYIQDIPGRRTLLTLGSANATTPGLLQEGGNVEVLVTLTGQRSRVGGVEDLMGPQHFGRLLRPYLPIEASSLDPAARAAERVLERARRAIAHAKMKIICEAATPSTTSDEVQWRTRLLSAEPLELEGVGNAEVWPITLGDGHKQFALDALRSGAPVELGALSIADISRFVAFRLSDPKGLATILFTIGCEIEGLSTDRISAVWRSVIDSREAFLRYLRLLLSNLDDPFGAQLAIAGASAGRKAFNSAPDEAVLEDMVRALDGGGERLDTIQRLMLRLVQHGDGEDIIPEDFKVIWRSFQEVLDEQEGQNDA